ncbi:MAG: hypothetical protein AAF573_04490 [Bacteroidota bacterium]
MIPYLLKKLGYENSNLNFFVAKTQNCTELSFLPSRLARFDFLHTIK